MSNKITSLENVEILNSVSDNGINFAIYTGEDSINLKNFALKQYHAVMYNNDEEIIGYYTHAKTHACGPISTQYMFFEVIDDLNVETIYASEGMTSIKDKAFHTDVFEFLTHVREMERAGIKEIPEHIFNFVMEGQKYMTVEEGYDMMREFTLNPPQPVNEDFSAIGDHMRFTTQEPGDKCHDGGEYGFYDHYVKTSIPGWFYNYTSTTCDFDPCGTGFQDIISLDMFDIEELKKKSSSWELNYNG